MSKNNQQAALAGAKARIITLERTNATLASSLEECKAALHGAEVSITQMVKSNREVVDNLDARMRSLYDINARLQSESVEQAEELRKRVVMCNTLRKEKSAAESKSGRYARRYKVQVIISILTSLAALLAVSTGGL